MSDQSPDIHHLSIPPGDWDHSLGAEDAPIVVVQYGDYQCPYTARTHPIMEEVRRRMGDELRFVYRQFPLNDIHPQAQIAAEAAEAAAAQGKFWEMHEKLFTHTRSLDEAHIRNHAESLGLDVDTFMQDLTSRRYAAKVQGDFESGETSGVESTPTFYINGLRYDGENEVEALIDAIQGARGLLPS